MTKLKAYTQGEVILLEVPSNNIPTTDQPLNPTGIVATGETGNHHQLQGGRFELFGNVRAANNLLKVYETTTLVHGSPATTGHVHMSLPPGTYVIKPQRERDLLARRSRAVLD